MNQSLKVVPAPLDITLYRGATLDVTLTYELLDARGAPISPIDITGWTGWLEIRKPDGEVLDRLTTENGRVVLGGTAGTVRFVISASASAAYVARDFVGAVYDSFLRDAAGNVNPFMGGNFTLAAAPST